MTSGVPQVLVEHESSNGAALSHVRGSLLVSSLQTLRELGLYERYLVHLPMPVHEPVLFALASSWLPAELAMAHYGACEAMNLSEQELKDIGEHVAKRILNTFMSTMLRGSRAVGMSARPLVVLQNYHRLWDRLLQGGGCTVRQTGLKDATIESRGVPMFAYRYFRFSYANLIRGSGLLFGRTLYTRALRSSDTAVTIQVSWV